MLSWDLPPEFDPAAVRRLHRGFAGLDDATLAAQYARWGRQEGLPGNGLQHRRAFAALVPVQARALEIGPFASPLLSGPKVHYCDVLDTAGLRQRAQALGLDAAKVPEVHHVTPDGSLDAITGTFDAVLSSHAIEHQPDLVAHLQQVERRLDAGGRYFLLIPDKRYCFDRDIAPSTIAEVLQAHEERRTRHTLRSLVEHRALATHNDAVAHWAEARPYRFDGRAVDAEPVRQALQEYRSSNGAYVDVHAWYFTPDSFLHLVRLLHALGLTALQVERLYRSRRNHLEFWAILSREPSAGGPYDAVVREPEDDLLPRRSGDAAAAEAEPARPKPSGGLLARTLRSLAGR
jgi:SAM-dependent methyltransferase